MVLRHRDFRLLLAGRFCANLAYQMQAVAVGWYLYDHTGDPLSLAYAGLAVFVPIGIFTLPGGDAADRLDRRRILAAAHLVQAACAGLFIALTAAGAANWLFYAVLALTGTARAFSGPAVHSFIPFLVPREEFASAVGWSASTNQSANVIGPALGGVTYLLGPGAVFGACLGLSLGVVGAALAIGQRVTGEKSGSGAWARLALGLAYLRRQPVVLGAISLDLFAVFLGGITAMLPVYAKDILAVGPDGLGLMRSSIAVGALGMALLLANLPAQRHPHAGRAMFLGVALFGAGILVFGLSQSFVLSLAVLFVMGAADMVSVFVRATVVQLGTPDDMRGRVSAVHMLCVGISNELGEFRAGLVAAWLGAKPAVLLGGVATLAVVVLWSGLFPQLRRIDRLAEVKPRAVSV